MLAEHVGHNLSLLFHPCRIDRQNASVMLVYHYDAEAIVLLYHLKQRPEPRL